MQKKHFKPFLLIVSLITVTGIAMAYSGKVKPMIAEILPVPAQSATAADGALKVSARLVQNKVLQGSDGTIGLELTLHADNADDLHILPVRNVDMVIVLDRSGSMKGPKLQDARQAVLNLLENLSPKDRFALVTYSDHVITNAPLQPVTENGRNQLKSIILNVRAGGGTNLSAGLQAGIGVLLNSGHSANAGRVILISDGLANKGVTNPHAIGSMAAVAVEKEFAVSTVGVGQDFNENLMTRIADQGTGNYYYLENPGAFAEVFQKEFYYAKTAAATNLAVHFPVGDGISLVNASGYPVTLRNGSAVFYPGNLRYGHTRRIYLTLQVPTAHVKNFELKGVKIDYYKDSQLHSIKLEKSFMIACVEDQQEVFSSIDKSGWADKVLKEDYNLLKEKVAADIKAGNKASAVKRIEHYRREKEEINASVQSDAVNRNLTKDLDALKDQIDETFQGAPSVVQQKQKANAKALQYEGYSGRRQK